METNVSATQKIEVSVINTKKEQSEELVSIESKRKLLIDSKIKKFGIRKDLLTGEEFVPLRKNQKFANGENRIIYYNNLTNETNNKILLDFKKNKYEEDQNSNWQDVLFYLLSLNEKSPKDKILFLMTKYSITKNEIEI